MNSFFLNRIRRVICYLVPLRNTQTCVATICTVIIAVCADHAVSEPLSGHRPCRPCQSPCRSCQSPCRPCRSPSRPCPRRPCRSRSRGGSCRPCCRGHASRTRSCHPRWTEPGHASPCPSCRPCRCPCRCPCRRGGGRRRSGEWPSSWCWRWRRWRRRARTGLQEDRGDAKLIKRPRLENWRCDCVQGKLGHIMWM